MRWHFWKWFFQGLNGKPGLLRLFDRWLVLHVGVGFGLAWLVEVPLHEAARTLILPLAGIFIGLSFAWAGNAQALLQTKKIEAIAGYHPDGIRHYVYTFQLAILILLVTLIAWGLAGLEVVSSESLRRKFSLSYHTRHAASYLVEAFLYFLSSLTLRECWHVVLGSQSLILLRHDARKSPKDDETS